MISISPRESQITFDRTVGIKVSFNSTLGAKIFFDKYNESVDENERKSFDDFLPLYLEYAGISFGRFRSFTGKSEKLSPFQKQMCEVLGQVLDDEIEDEYGLNVKFGFENSDDWKEHFVYGVFLNDDTVFISKLDDKYYDYPMTQEEFIKILYPADKIPEAIERVKIFTRENGIDDDEIKVYMC